MTTYDGFNDTPSGSHDAAKIFIIRAVADYSKHPCAASDSLRIAKVEAGTMLLGGAYKVATAEGTASTKIDVGYALNGNSILNSLSMNTTTSWTKVTAPKFSADTFKEYTSDGYIFAKNVALAADNAKVYFQIYAVKVTDNITN